MPSRELKESALRSEIERLRLESLSFANKMEVGRWRTSTTSAASLDQLGRASPRKGVLGGWVRVRLGQDQQGAPPIPTVLNLEQLRADFMKQLLFEYMFIMYTVI